ncbi:MAG TPA: beta-ketoacyl-ACP synthase II [Chloroflexota bacterium]|nr:beta-ketoacyl-ACP synthase II [Chloroflexota bacterium]
MITGMGVVSSLGLGAEQFWRAVKAGETRIDRISHFDPSPYPSQLAGEVRDFKPGDWMDTKETRRMSRSSQFAVAAAKMAVGDAGLRIEGLEAERTGVFLGTGIGTLGMIPDEHDVLLQRGPDRVSPFFIPSMLPNMGAAQVSRLVGAKGYNSTTVTACAAGTQAIGEGLEVIRRGAAEVMLVGGCDASICALGLAGFCAIRALSCRNDDPRHASRPFDLHRDGFVPGEGAAILVIEELNHALTRGARIYAELAGFGASADAYHMVAPEPEGDGAARAMLAALENAGVTTDEVDYINAHGTSTQLNDVTETRAIKRVFGERAARIPISSTKSMLGHLLGASGGLESVATVLSMRDGFIHPTINLEAPDPECDLDYVPNRGREATIKVALKNSFGFGGQNACLVFKRF